MKSHLLYSRLVTAAALAALGAGQALAQSAPAPDVLADTTAADVPDQQNQDKAEIIIVTGTRVTGLVAADSPAPIQVLDIGTLEDVGQPDLIQALAQNIPSFTAQSFGGDTAALTLSAKLRGVSPNHALVLVNGKRRHGTANLAVLGGPYQGGAGADLNFIPVASIDHVEVLLDGAAAQYGSDAIAGVINIIQKTADSGGSITASGGMYFDGGGETGDLTGSAGWKPFDNAFVNFAFESKFHDFSFRGDFDPRVVDGPWNTGITNSPARSYPQIFAHPDWPYVNRIAGDPQYRLNVGTYNAGMDISDTLHIYTFGSYGFKKAQAHENFRLPNVVTGKLATDIPFPLGFDPREGSVEQDYQIATGIKGEAGPLRWDLSTTYGEDKVKISVLNTANVDFYKDTSVLATGTTPYIPGYTPRNVLAGSFHSTQWTTTLDGAYEVDMGWSEPMTLAAGIEYREDGYQLGAGNPVSYYKGGTQSFYGFAPVNASDNTRTSSAVYFDVAAKPLSQLTLDAAVRYGDFSDFGSTTVGKLTARWDFNDSFAVRGTASTGFRAPTLAEGYYAGINVSPTSISGQLPPNSPGASLLGINGLDPEESTNFSIGFVAHPIPRLTATLDVYQISIDDRIVGSGSLLGASSNPASLVSPSVVAAIQANGVIIDSSIFSNPSWSIGASVFTNGLDTETNGADFVLTYSSDFGAFGDVDWTASANWTKTEVTRIAPPPSQLSGGVVLFDAEAISNLETTSPEYRVMAGAIWSLGDYTANLKGTYYGPSSGLALDSFGTPTYRKTEIDAQLVLDLSLSYAIGESWDISIGANNITNEYPDQINALHRAHRLAQNSNAFVTKYPSSSPFGINGGYYYGKLTYSF
jgi:iron complex outermembrane receptor protein